MRAASIVCPGPSLDSSIIPCLHEQCEIVAAVNRGYRAWESYENLCPSVIYVMDGPHCWKKHERYELAVLVEMGSVLITREDGDTLCKWHEAIGRQRVYSVRCSRQSAKDSNPFEDITILHRPMKGLLIAWQHLIRLGFHGIAIAGADCCSTAEQRYFFDGDPQDGEERLRLSANSSYGEVMETLNNWLPYAQQIGVESVNISGEQSKLKLIMDTIAPTGISAWINQTQSR